jgi:hypothetical protein
MYLTQSDMRRFTVDRIAVIRFAALKWDSREWRARSGKTSEQDRSGEHQACADERLTGHVESLVKQGAHTCFSRVESVISEASSFATRAIGWTLVAVGALTTIPLALQLLADDE